MNSLAFSNYHEAETPETGSQETFCSENLSERSCAWSVAIESLSKEDIECLSQANVAQNDHHAVLQSLLEATNQKKKECMKKRWKVTIRGHKIVLRDILEKISVWVSKVIHIGDVAVQYDPVSAAIPWAAIRLIMQASVNEVEVFGYVLQSLENITNVIASCNVFKHQYFHPGQTRLKVFDQMSRALTKLYSSILQYLAKIIHYYKDNSVIRFIKSTVFSKTDMESWYATIEVEKKEVWNLAQLAEAEKTESILAGIRFLSMESHSAKETDKGDLASLKHLLAELSLPIKRVTDDLEGLRDGLERAERAKILKAISSIPHRLHHKAVRKDRLKGSGQWLLQHPAFRSWRQESTSSVIWLHGIPGSGKTKLASLVVDELEGNENIAFFYCARNPAEPQRGQGDRILASLVRQLAVTRTNSVILPPIVAKYEEALSGFADFEDQDWTMEDSGEALMNLMEEYPSATLILDALDEVDQEDRQQLMDVLSQLLRESPNLVKVFISSRDSHDIYLLLSGSPNIYIHAEDNADDIKAYIANELAQARLLNGRLSNEMRTEISNTLSRGAHGMFRWVALQIQFLRPLKVAADIRARLGVLPATLEETYWEIYQQIQESGDHAAKLANFTFQWLMYAKDTISPEAFAAIASSYFSETSPGTTYDPLEVIDVCANLVVLRTGINSIEPALAHLSVREFFESLPNRDVHMFLPAVSHSALAAACIRHMMYNLDNYIGSRLAHVHSGTTYSAYHWHTHVQDSLEHRELLPHRLKSLIGKFIFDDQNSGNISPTFEQWCVLMRTSSANDLDHRVTADPVEPLWLPCVMNWPEIVELVCDLGCRDSQKHKRPLSNRDKFFMLEPFRYVVEENLLTLVAYLGRRMLDMKSLRSKKTAPLAVAVECGNMVALRRLLAQEHGGIQTEIQALVYAAELGQLDAFQTLVEHNELALNTAGQQVMHAALTFAANSPRGHNEAIEFVEFLLDIKTPITSAASLLCSAAIIEDTRLVRLFLNRRIGYNARSKALVIAISNGDQQTEELLLRFGTQRVDDMAVVRALKLEAPLAAANLIKAGFDIEGQYLEKARTALHYASEKGFSDVVKCLLDRNVGVDVCDLDGKTPLHLASQNGKVNCVRMLLDHGADVMHEDGEGRVALDIASDDSTEGLIIEKMQKLLDGLQKRRKLTQSSRDTLID